MVAVGGVRKIDKNMDAYYDIRIQVSESSFTVAGKKLKSKTGWNDRKDGTSGNGTDEFGFSALPGGNRRYNVGYFGYFGLVGYYGLWWSATEYGAGSAYYRGMLYDDDDVYETYYDESYGFSVRCVQDN
jgi:uncharacterized protein (TIGR02145 family)